MVYVGQGAERKNKEGLLRRMLEQHEKKADDWTEAIALTSKTDELGATELCYLEHHLYKLVKEAGRCVLLNRMNLRWARLRLKRRVI